MITALGQVLGDWAAMPEWSDIHFWRYAFPSRNIDAPFLESTQQTSSSRNHRRLLPGEFYSRLPYVSGKKAG